MKALKVVFLKKPLAQLEKEKEYYREKQEGLEMEFVAEVAQTLKLLAAFPTSGPLRYSGQRVCILKRFPYLVFYKIKKDNLVVVKLIHKKRHPKHWK